MSDDDFQSIVRWLLYGTIGALLLLILVANVMTTVLGGQ